MFDEEKYIIRYPVLLCVILGAIISRCNGAPSAAQEGIYKGSLPEMLRDAGAIRNNEFFPDVVLLITCYENWGTRYLIPRVSSALQPMFPKYFDNFFPLTG